MILKIRLMFLLLLAAILTWPALSSAQSFKDRNFDKELSLFKLRMEYNQAYESMSGKSDLEIEEYAFNYRGPAEPFLPKVKFKNYATPEHLQGRIESLVHGVTIGLPAEYDHYGYELRRQMKSIGNFNVYKSRELAEEQLTNISKARVIFKYWRESLNAKTKALSEEVEDGNGGSKEITTLNVNEALLKAFMIEIQSWMNANEAFLHFIIENQRTYKIVDGNILRFASAEKRKRFRELYEVRERSRHEIYKYDPFRIMVY